tara:strand:- start:1231 stop:2262 length:1032 start_codon:yes stop_codon:yes gene_type:complete
MITNYLSQKDLVQNIATVKELEDKVRSGKPLNMMMGQTFDAGQPVDMMKYALFMMNLSDMLQDKGVDITNNWLIADHFIVDINQDQAAAEAKKQVKQRVSYLRRLNEVYDGNIGFVLSSELSSRSDYKENLEILFAEADRNPRFKELVMEAIPQDRRDNPSALRYPFEELATIQTMDTDVKVGPPYEALYDEPAREFAPIVGFNKYVAIQLTRAFPFGRPEIPAETLAEIETFGVLPYKRGSKGLEDYRIDPLNDGLDRIQELVGSTKDIRAVIDLLVIIEQVRQRLEKDASLFAGSETDLYEPHQKPFKYDAPEIAQNLHSRQFQGLVIDFYKEFIHKPLRS